MAKRGIEFGGDISGAFAATGMMQGVVTSMKTGAYVGSALKYTHAVLADEFDQSLDLTARMAPNLYKHVYEWGMVGLPAGRLWRHNLRGRSRNRTATFEFMPSKVPVPVPKTLTTPGKSGRTVKEGVHIFVWKAPILEYGLTVHIAPKNAKTLVFVMPSLDPDYTYEASRDRAAGRNTGIMFTKGPVTAIPGEKVKGAFTTYFSMWWSTQGPERFDQKIRAELERDMQGVQYTGYIEGFRVGRAKSKSFSILTATGARGNNSRVFRKAQREAEQYYRGLAGKYDRQAAIRRRKLYGV